MLKSYAEDTFDALLNEVSFTCVQSECASL